MSLRQINTHSHSSVSKHFTGSVCDTRNTSLTCVWGTTTVCYVLSDVLIHQPSPLIWNIHHYMRHKELVMAGISESLTALVKPFIFAKTCSTSISLEEEKKNKTLQSSASLHIYSAQWGSSSLRYKVGTQCSWMLSLSIHSSAVTALYWSGTWWIQSLSQGH